VSRGVRERRNLLGLVLHRRAGVEENDFNVQIVLRSASSTSNLLPRQGRLVVVGLELFFGEILPFLAVLVALLQIEVGVLLLDLLFIVVEVPKFPKFI
jgi:hypothetical protein